MVAKVFKTSNSRVIRIPKSLLPDVEYDDIEVMKEASNLSKKVYTRRSL